jgi:deoxyribonuclease-4
MSFPGSRGYAPGVLLGAHVSSAGGIYQATGRAMELGCRALQVFPQSPRVWKPAVHPDEHLARFRESAAEADLVALCHAPYLVNLAGTDELTVERSEAVLAQALRTGRGLGALAVIVHLGSHLGSGFEAGLERAVPVLQRVLELAGDGTWLLLENTAGAGGTMGLTVEELALVIERCGEHPWLGVCLDSAHLYASGIDVGDAATVDALLDELDAKIGLGRLKALHVNDSQTELGSNRDRHANIGEGLIGDRLSAFLGRPRLQGLPAVIETAGHEGKGPDALCMRQLERLWHLGISG